MFCSPPIRPLLCLLHPEVPSAPTICRGGPCGKPHGCVRSSVSMNTSDTVDHSLTPEITSSLTSVPKPYSFSPCPPGSCLVMATVHRRPAQPSRLRLGRCPLFLSVLSPDGPIPSDGTAHTGEQRSSPLVPLAQTFLSDSRSLSF